MGKRDFQELMDFARSNNLMNVPLYIVIQKFSFVYTKNPACPHGLQGYPKNNLT